MLRAEAAAYKLDITIGKALGFNVFGCVRICSIIPLKSAVKIESGSEVLKPILGAKNIVQHLIKVSKVKDFAKLKVAKSISFDNVFDKFSLVYLSDVSTH